MNFRTLTLKYLGWCPGVKAAASFIPNKEISNKALIQVYVLVIVASLSVAIPYLLFFKSPPLPAWIIAEKGGKPSGTFIEVEEQDLLKYPKLAEAVHQADWASRPGVDITPPGPMIKMTPAEVRALLDFLGDEYVIIGKSYRFTIRLKENIYRIWIELGFDPPKIL